MNQVKGNSIEMAQAVDVTSCEAQLAIDQKSSADNLIEKNEKLDDSLVNSAKSTELWGVTAEGEEVWLANFVPKIEADVNEIYLTKTERKIKLGLYIQGELAEELICSVSDLGRKDFYYKNFGLASGIRHKANAEEDIKQHLLETRGKIPIVPKYCFKGRSDDNKLFVSEPLGLINRDDEMGVEPAEMEYVLEFLLKIFSSKHTHIMLVANFLASLMTLFDKNGLKRPDFAVMLIAESNSRKTTVACLVSNYVAYGKATVSFEATAASLSEIQKTYRDHAMVTDDVRPDVVDLDEKVNTVIRAVADPASAKQKMKGGAVTSAVADAIPIITAEMMPALIKSSVYRTIFLPFNPEDVDTDILRKAQDNIERYKTFGKKLLVYTMREEDLVFQIHKKYHTYDKEYQNSYPGLKGRTCGNYAWIRAGFEQIVLFCVEALPEYREALESELQSLVEYIDERLRIEEQEAVLGKGAKKYILRLMHMKARGKVSFGKLYYNLARINAKDDNNTVLWYDNEYVYFRMERVAEYLNKEAADEDYVTHRQLRQMLHEDRCLEKRKNLLTTDKTINGKTERVSRVERKRLYEIYQIDWSEYDA